MRGRIGRFGREWLRAGSLGLVALLAIGATALPQPVAAASLRAAMRMPFDASGGRTGLESPATHHHFHSSGFAWDLHATPGAAVRARFVSPDGPVKVEVGSISKVPGDAGKVVEVKVLVAGTVVGRVFFQHLARVQVREDTTYPAKTLLGYLVDDDLHPTSTSNCADGTADGWPWSSAWQVCTAASIHTHIDVRRGCYRSLGTQADVRADAAILMLSTAFSSTHTGTCEEATLDTVGLTSRVTVDALDGTGLRSRAVDKGERVWIHATGTWCMGGTPPNAECGTPDGIRAANPEELPLVLDSAQIGALITRVGGGPWADAGSEHHVTADRDGRVILLFNDRPASYGDNSGSIEVTVTGGM